MSVASPVVTKSTTIRPVPKPKPKPARPFPPVVGIVARKLADAQGRAFEDIAADLDAADALVVGRTVDLRRDEHVRQALRLVRLARKDRQNAVAYLALADGHLREAIGLDRIVDEHGGRAARQVDASLEHGRAVVGIHESLLRGRDEESST